MFGHNEKSSPSAEIVVDAPTVTYDEQVFANKDSAEKHILAIAKERGVDHMQITSLEAKFLTFLLASSNCRIGVELGTLVGYSAAAIARALPADGLLITIEADPSLARAATEVLASSDLPPSIEVIRAKALDVLNPQLHLSEVDFCFIDAKWSEYPAYLAWAKENVRPGGLIIAHDVHAMGFVIHNPECVETFEESIYSESRATCFEFEGSAQERKVHIREAVHAMREFNRSLAEFSNGNCFLFPSNNGLLVARAPNQNMRIGDQND